MGLCVWLRSPVFAARRGRQAQRTGAGKCKSSASRSNAPAPACCGVCALREARPGRARLAAWEHRTPRGPPAPPFHASESHCKSPSAWAAPGLRNWPFACLEVPVISSSL
ncbi:unnamed protein product [Eretmochelys imbricata]